ncbi:phage tail protein [Mesorhizobium yinganensis]|uniref:phage tail protein n=1 Tax=Mesorhizobium yinganensis TaxID=3157707 RepID=UPI0032B7D0E2
MTLPATPTLADLTPRAQRLAGLVPGVYHRQDARTQPERPLLRLLQALAEPLDMLEAAVDTLHEDHFVETASDEALALIADLVDARLYRDGAPTNRAVIAQMIHWLRRKGTVQVLEDVISGSTGWSAEVEEAFRSLFVTQRLDHPVPQRGLTAVTWDPIGLADPLSRRAARGTGPRDAARLMDRDALVRAEGETVEAALRRLGQADAGRIAVAPRNLDLNGWAQPHIALIRTSRLASAFIEARSPGSAHPLAGPDGRGTIREIAHRHRANVSFIGFTFDPAGGVERAVWDAPVEADYAAARLTPAHEPPPEPVPERRATQVLTPTALAVAGAEVEASGALQIEVDGVCLVGADVPEDIGPAEFRPVIGDPVLRLADADRPSPADRWTLRLVALDNDASIAATVAGNVALGAAGAENAATLEFRATKGLVAAPTEGPAARFQAGGAVAAIRLTRDQLDRGYRRAPNGDWTSQTFGVAGGAPLSPVVAMADAGPLRLVRLERRGVAIGLAALQPASGPGWSFAPLDLGALAAENRPDTDAPVDGPFHALVAASDGSLLLIGADEPEAGLGLWRIADPLGNPAIDRMDAAPALHPAARLLPMACLHGDRLCIFGGADEAADGAEPEPRDDLWSIALAGPEAFTWRPHHMRLPRGRQGEIPRIGGQLVSTPEGLVAIGGASKPGSLSAAVFLSDLAGPRPRWTELSDIPLEEAGAPGALWAAHVGGRLQVLVWANRTAPRLMRLNATATRWEQGPLERDGSPNPPTDGDALFVGEEFIVTGPPPLPPSEVVFSRGARAQIAFLPAVHLTREADMALFIVEVDGTARRWLPPGELAQPSFHLGGGRAAPTAIRREVAPRFGACERLAWQPLKLRQVSLSPWDKPLALDLSDTVGVDPRLGRVVMRQGLAPGRISFSKRVARPAPAGPGFEAFEPSIQRTWADPGARGDAVVRRVPRDLDMTYVDPQLAGEPAPLGLYAADLAMATSGGNAHVVFAGSPRLGPTHLRLAEGSRTVIGHGAPSHVPFIAPDPDGTSLTLAERMSAGGEADEGPHVWLGGLDLGGRLEGQMSAGRIDVRWSWLGRPGATGLSVLGAGFQSGPALYTVPEAMLFVFLHGCHVGRAALPPWAQLIATGCTFDAGDRGAAAIDATGGRIRLRHCTVLGTTLAGQMEASSCVFAGEVIAGRPDLGHLRFSVLPEGGRPPMQFRSMVAPVSFTSALPGCASYLALDDNNPPALMMAGERGQSPGAYADRVGACHEMISRTEDFLPMGMTALHEDRTRRVGFAMNRRLP